MGILDRFGKQRPPAPSDGASARELLLQTVIDAAPFAIVLLDELGTIVFANAGARSLFFETEPAEGANFLGLLTRAPQALREALLSDTDHIFGFESHGASETYHLAKRHLSLAGKPHSVLIVRNMTLELSRQENAVLRKAIRVIHHEFANSLAPVLSLLQSARGRLDRLSEKEPKLAQILGVVEERVVHLNGFLSGFAALGRLPKPRHREVEWRAFIDSLRALHADIAIADAPPGSGWFDPAQIEQVVLNLVKNAREAGSAPGEIALQVLPADEGGQYVTVLDRGAGMNDEVLASALVPSFTTKPGGSGIGLALCREIVDAHHGSLRIARREGGGTAVSFWLPAREAPAAAQLASRAKLTLTRM